MPDEALKLFIQQTFADSNGLTEITYFKVRVFIVFFYGFHHLVDEFLVTGFLLYIQCFHIHVRLELPLVASAIIQDVFDTGQ